MDLSFLQRIEARFARGAAVHPDFGMLVAALAAGQAASPAVRAQGGSGTVSLADPLAELILCGPLWREARRAQRGTFNPRLARKPGVN